MVSVDHTGPRAKFSFLHFVNAEFISEMVYNFFFNACQIRANALI